jgi:hypothetical protein
VFSPDGRLLAGNSGLTDSALRVWDLAAGGTVHNLGGHQHVVDSLAFSPDGRRLVSAGWETSALVWDVARLKSGPAPGAGTLTRQELEALWRDLSGDDPGRAHAAIWKLAGAPRWSVPFLRRQFPVLPPDGKHLARLVAQLDDDDFARREQASRELERLGEAAEAALRQALRGRPSAELRLRAQRLLRRLEKGEGSPSPHLIALRGLEVLEKAGTLPARTLLGELARGGKNEGVARAAQQALRRLARQPLAP